MHSIELIGNSALRLAVSRNLVSFPSQVPGFMRRHRGEVQSRIVQLYFVRGWAVGQICTRYQLHKVVVTRLLSEWRIRAIASGYIQDIRPDATIPLAEALDCPGALSDGE
jgi:hypothetical protein